MANNKIRIRLKSFDHKILDASAEKIITSANESNNISEAAPLVQTKTDESGDIVW